ncbi:hypothetical protein TcasGA2_TC014212 [Tribolium castaneum]|uniref:Uncharacterized protein n=1 Tax=Tribolium castaneum TaxID=7070 RepID=D6W725_TRICA|nr:hypothetical protein TcasGA2_TC014212 [Tribolium castaneum]
MKLEIIEKRSSVSKRQQDGKRRRTYHVQVSELKHGANKEEETDYENKHWIDFREIPKTKARFFFCLCALENSRKHVILKVYYHLINKSTGVLSLQRCVRGEINGNNKYMIGVDLLAQLLTVSNEYNLSDICCTFLFTLEITK